jgi:hypothetical protein
VKPITNPVRKKQLDEYINEQLAKIVAGMSFRRVLEGDEFCAHLETPVNLDHVVCGDRHVRPFEKVRPDVGSECDAAESVLLSDSELLYNA